MTEFTVNSNNSVYCLLYL